MQLRFVVTPTGTLRIFAESGTFATAKPAIEKAIQDLAAAGLVFDRIEEVEQHRHDDVHTHTSTHTHTTT